MRALWALRARLAGGTLCTSRARGASSAHLPGSTLWALRARDSLRPLGALYLPYGYPRSAIPDVGTAVALHKVEVARVAAIGGQISGGGHGAYYLYASAVLAGYTLWALWAGYALRASGARCAGGACISLRPRRACCAL